MQRVLNAEATQYLEKEVRVAGWVNSIRSHGKIIFVDLRDRSGLLQLVFSPAKENLYKLAQKMKPEWVIGVEGKIAKRPSGMINPKIETGKIELQPESVEIFSEAKLCLFPLTLQGMRYQKRRD